jgi:hypothetical protein
VVLNSEDGLEGPLAAHGLLERLAGTGGGVP